MVLLPVSHQFHAYGAAAILFDWLDGREEPPEEAMIVGPAGTGKSLGIGKFLWGFLDRWPEAKVLVIRKTLASLRESWQDTFENEVLWPEHPSVVGRQREHRTKYVHPNGAELILGGMDQKTRLFSTQYHIIFAEELIELTEIEWMSLHRALRRPGGPGWHLLLGGTNPDAEFHWANRRFPMPKDGQRCATKDGRMRILSFHKDNPTITKKYKHRLFNQLTGHMRDRLALGLWRTAAGLVYDTYHPDVHLQAGRLKWPADAFGKPIRGETVTLELTALGYSTELTWFGASMDFGYTSAGCLQVWGVDAEDRAYRVAEVYRTKKDIEWWADWAADLWHEFRFRFIACDGARPDLRDKLNKLLAAKGCPQIAKSVKKPTRKFEMFNVVRYALLLRQDAFPGLVLIRDALRGGPDPDLKEASLPTRTEEEIIGLMIKKPKETDTGEVPTEESDEACKDHGCDALGYFFLESWGKDLSRRVEAVTSRHSAFEALNEDAYTLAKKERFSKGKGRGSL